MSVADVARIWQAAGVSVIPILSNQTKRPAVQWSPYIARPPRIDEVQEWWGNGKPYGLALICGAVSGNLEMTEIEGRAMGSEAFIEILHQMDELGVGHIWDLLYGPEGFTETSPSGGIHFLYRISDHEVPGNTKIAQKAVDEKGQRLCLAETRGHGGYVITAPTPGICHPSGEPWVLREGQYGVLPTITWQERNLFHEALRLALDEDPPSVSRAVVPSHSSLVITGGVRSETTQSPGDDFEAHTDWAEILEPHGWQLESRHGRTRNWTRPGKDRRDGGSATTGRADDRDRLYVFSTSTGFEAEVPYTKFGAYALLNHGGDHHAAAQELVRLGFGERRTPPTLDLLDAAPPPTGSVHTGPDEDYTFDDVGNAMRLAKQTTLNYRYIWEEKRFYRWTGSVWQYDFDGAITREMVRMTESMRAQAMVDDNEALAKWAKASRSATKIQAAISLAKTFGLTHSSGDWAPQRNLLNVQNGVLDLHTGELHPHDRAHLMTHTFGAAYNPQAACPQFEQFMAQAIPDEAMRRYVQRALGYSLLGDADQRSMFLIVGPSGTGKSTLMDTMRELFAGYGATAPAGTFRAVRNDKTPNNDLHSLRGARFVTTSETSEGAAFDEELLKRLTGRDKVTSRALYQEHVEWVPEFTLWLATNHMPRLNSDDDAIWRRTKLIPFTTVFLGDGQIPDMARKVLVPEADGILNWLLAGLRDFLANGLQEPQEVRELTQEQRVQADSVARFMDDRLTDGVVLEDEGLRIRSSELFAMYVEWIRQSGERALSSRRFANRLQSNYPKLHQVRDSGHLFWVGIGRNQGTWILGVPYGVRS